MPVQLYSAAVALVVRDFTVRNSFWVSTFLACATGLW